MQSMVFFVIEPAFIKNDEQVCTLQTNQVQSILDNRISSLTTITQSYAIWDDTYRYASDRNAGYIDNNFDDFTFNYLDLNVVAIVDSHSNLVYYQTYDHNNQEKVATSSNMQSFLSSMELWQFSSFNDTNYGVVIIDGQPLMVVSAPILTSEAKGPSVGGLLFGTYLDTAEISTLKGLSGIDFKIVEPESLKDSNSLSMLISGQVNTVVKTNDSYTDLGYQLLLDIYGQPDCLVQVTTQRGSYQTSLYLQNIFMVISIVIAGAFAVIIYFILEREIVKPLMKMAGYVEAISLNPNFSPPKDDAVTEEFAVLTDAVENTLKRKLEGMNEVSMMVAHDLRNPLAGIKYSTYVLRKHYGEKLDREGQAILDRIDDSVRYSNNIVQNLLDYSAEIKLNRIKVSAKELVDQTLAKLAVPNNTEVTNQANTVDSVMVDSAKVERVFTNLVGNAFDAMPSGGKLQINSRREGGFVRFDFADSGVGLSDKALANLWKPFFTTKAKGMGIGLSICKRIVDAHGGRIEVQSKPGQGACFSVYLPVV
jgi:signal transduction histidine kinase